METSSRPALRGRLASRKQGTRDRVGPTVSVADSPNGGRGAARVGTPPGNGQDQVTGHFQDAQSPAPFHEDSGDTQSQTTRQNRRTGFPDGRAPCAGSPQAKRNVPEWTCPVGLALGHLAAAGDPTSSPEGPALPFTGEPERRGFGLGSWGCTQASISVRDFPTVTDAQHGGQRLQGVWTRGSLPLA